jgi:hypothetical protein
MNPLGDWLHQAGSSFIAAPSPALAYATKPNKVEALNAIFFA